LHGSEYWTHFLPERVGQKKAEEITEGKKAYTAEAATEMLLIDRVLANNVEQFQQVLHSNVLQLVAEEGAAIIERKTQKMTPEHAAALEAARGYELAVMKRDFTSREYNNQRRNFVFKKKASATPPYLSDRMGVVLNGSALGKKIRKKIGKDVAARMESLPSSTPPPGLGIIQLGGLKDSSMYVNMKLKAGKELGFKGVHKMFDAGEGAMEAMQTQIMEWNADPTIHGIMVQLPLTGMESDGEELLYLIDPAKDVDCLNPRNFHTFLSHSTEMMGAAEDKHHTFMPPCPVGILDLLHRYQVPLKGKLATVIGTSSNLGIPVASLLSSEGCSVTSINIQSRAALESQVINADIIIAAADVANLVKPHMITKRGVVIVDAGICLDPLTGKLCGAVDPDCRPLTKLMTPVPGGVGPMTVAVLLKNTWLAWERSLKQDTVD